MKQIRNNYIYIFLKNIYFLIVNFFIDAYLFFRHSTVFFQNTFNKTESKIILHYHSIEKGFLHENFKFRFGRNIITDLIKLLKKEEIIKNNHLSQIASAYLAICKYYEKHQESKVDISDYYSKADYVYFKSLTTLNNDIVLLHKKSDYFNNSENTFAHFTKSRKSIRNFTDEKISFDTIQNVIKLAKTAPSVCNRQPIRIYYVDKKQTIDKIFDIQKGLKGYTESIFQLLIIVSDRNYFYKIGERNQMYIDGGIFLMNLLHALHYYKIGACPAHWGINYKQDLKIKKLIGLHNSQKVISLLPIGIPNNEFKTTMSLRRSNDEILKRIE